MGEPMSDFVFVNVRMEKKLKEALKDLAKKNGLTLSAHIRIKLLEATKEQPNINLKVK